MRRALAFAVALTVGGCAQVRELDTFNPVDWWHGLEGGKIAETRPPPPNADAPYPSLGSVPTAKPPPPDAKLRASMAGGLVADRTNAQYDAKLQPLPAAGPPAARRPPPPPAPNDPDQPNASLPAANAQPVATAKPVATVVKTAPVAPVAASPLAPPPSAATTVAAAAPAVAADVPMPAMPDTPPPPPILAGVSVPAVTAPTLPPVAPPPPPPAALPPPGVPMAVPFPAGSAILPSDALTSLKHLAQTRGTRNISVVGFGDATSSDTATQSAALPLALSRARAVAAGLQSAGVPPFVIRIAAEPQGSGATARLVN